MRASSFKSLGLDLGVPMAKSNPRKLIKRSERNAGIRHLGFLPVDLVEQTVTIHQTMSMNYLASVLDDVLLGVDRLAETMILSNVSFQSLVLSRHMSVRYLQLWAWRQMTDWWFFMPK